MEISSIISVIGELFNEAPKIVTGLLIFPPLLYLVKRLAGRSDGQGNSNADFMAHFKPSKEDLYSYRNNFMLVMLNVFTWTALFVVFDTYLVNFWEDTFGVTRLNPFGGWPLLAQAFVLLFILDFTNYWSHRLLHRPWTVSYTHLTLPTILLV